MTPLTLTIWNWCQFAGRHEFTFAQGMNALQGPNGSGKSNLLDALNMCIGLNSNNSKSRSVKITDNITNGEDRSTLILLFTSDGHKGTVTVEMSRNYREDSAVTISKIQAAKHQVELGNAEEDITKLASMTMRENVRYKVEYEGKVLTKKGDVEEFIYEHTQLLPAVISSNYFPEQGEVDSVIGADNEQRQKVFHDKAGTNLCQRIWTELGKEIANHQGHAGLDTELTKLKAKVAERQHVVNEAKQAFDEASKVDHDTDPLLDTIRKYQKGTELRNKHVERRSELTSLSNRVKELEEALRGQKAQVVETKKRLEELQGMAGERDELIEDYEQASKRQEMVDNARIELEEAELAIEELGDKPSITIDNDYLSSLADDIADIKSNIRKARDFLEKYGDGNCPTCGQSWADGHEVAENHRASLPDFESQLSNQEDILESARKTRHKEDEAIRKWHSDQDRWGRQRAQAQKVIENTQLIEKPSRERYEAAIELRDEHIQLEATYKAQRNEFNAGVDKRAQVVKEVELVDQSCKSILKQLEGVPGEDEFRKASDALMERQVAAQQVREARANLNAAETLLADAKAELQKVEAEDSKSKPSRIWCSVAAKVRDLFHRDQVPKAVIAWYAQRLTELTTEYMKLFESDFSISISSDMTLYCTFPEKTLPSGRLSGGQKNMLNIAMRLAMLDLFPSNLNLLVLDEVEVHLDQANVSRLPMVLERVKGLARNRGLVVLFISHHPSLADVSDHVVRLMSVTGASH